MAAHAIGTTDSTPTPMSVKVLRNVDIPALAIALVLFLVAGFEILGWVAGTAAWIAQRLIAELATRGAERSEDLRTRVGLLTGSMILRGWVVAGIIFGFGLGNSEAGLGAAVLFLAVFTLQTTMTMAMRPFEPPAQAARRGAR